MKIGVERLMEDLLELGYKNVTPMLAKDNTKFVCITEFSVPAGIHQGRIIDLAIPIPDDYPRGVGAAIHVRCSPQLYEIGSIPNVRNIVASVLGNEWRYWSNRFKVKATNPTLELLTQITNVFKQN
jgi:hypothetical protein